MPSADAMPGVQETHVAVEDLTAASDGDLKPKEVFKIRSYQLEMLEESMKRNIIVAMDTGAGKTLIAILRIQAELERCPPEKLCWILCPTVELASQQYNVVLRQLPAFQARLLSGIDNVEYWTKQWIWDEVLKDIRIVVSTHQILLDALSHGFVRLQRVALLVFDEAHSCINNHPSSRILKEFYHPIVEAERPVVLGLTASPVVNSKVGNLGALEANLNAISRTPKLHREELLRHVHPPELIQLTYHSASWSPSSPALASLRKVYSELDIEQDPWIVKLRSDSATCDSKALNKALLSNKTYSHDQIKDLFSKAQAVCNELGSSPTDYFLQRCIHRFQHEPTENSIVEDIFDNEERAYLQKKLSEVDFNHVEGNLAAQYPLLSPKVHVLIDFLKQEDASEFSGLIFVQTRAEVVVLSHVLSVHIPSFDISTFIGASSFSGRKSNISELADVKNQKTTLDDLRHGRKNLIVTTNALEEGIDVSRCKLVICFDRPRNLKSFIQRRGRARKSDSRYVIMFEEGLGSERMAEFAALEEEMKRLYMDEMRQLEELHKKENLAEADLDSRPIFDQTTGARVTISDAVQHLYHFCATLPPAPYVDRNPIFSFQNHSVDPQNPAISATVILPNTVDASIRQASSGFRWRTETMAKRDAALECYRTLHTAGLIDEHLLPLGHVDEAIDEAYSAVEKRPGLVDVRSQSNPWRRIAREWLAPTTIYASMIKIVDKDTVRSEMHLLLPCEIPEIGIFDLYWGADTTYKVVFEKTPRRLDHKVITCAMQTTSLLLTSIFRGRLDAREDFTALFTPCHIGDLTTWVKNFEGAIKVTDLDEISTRNELGLIRDLSRNRVPYVFRDIQCALAEGLSGGSDGTGHGDVTKVDYPLDMQIDSTGGVYEHSVNAEYRPPRKKRMTDRPSYEKGVDHPGETITRLNQSMDLDEDKENETIALFNVTKLPKKIDFLHYSPGEEGRALSDSKLRTLPVRNCEIDRLPYKYSQFAMFIPSILHKIQVALVVDRLCKDMLSELQFQDHGLVTTAISASSANEGTDYQMLEFFGDSMLKYFTSLTLMAAHLNWHEGILSHKKDHIVSNTSLASAASKAGLDKYILTKAFTGRKWRPIYNSSVLEHQQEQTREMASKTLADVVEALIGAAYLDGGPQKALTCLKIFFPDVHWLTSPEACKILSTIYDIPIQASPHHTQVEQLISHSFTSKSLLIEALTHPSHHGPNSSSSYQRLEFLGDAILDNIVTRTAFAHAPPIPTPRLHLIRTALVNGNFLGFLCLHHSMPQTRIVPVTNDPKHISVIETTRPFHLWQAMRHASPTVAHAQQACVARYETLQPLISALLKHGTHYPWTLLARLEPPKPMSDMIESLLGAIYIDTSGSLPACEGFLEHIGLMRYLRGVVESDIALLHPKEEVGILADRENVRYKVGKGEGGKSLWCRVLVGGREVVKVGDGMGILEVQTRGAEEACKVLREEKRARGEEGKGKGEGGREGEEQGEREDEGEDEDDEKDEEADMEVEKKIDQGVGVESDDGDSDAYMTADE